MKKENLILTSMVILMTVVAVILLVIQNQVPTSKLDKLFGEKVTLKDETPIIDVEYSGLVSKAQVYNRKNNKIADVYIIRTDHNYFYLELYVAIDLDGKVYVAEKEIVTKDDTSESYYPEVRDYILKNYSGLYYENVQFIDGAAGATTIQVSRSYIKTAVTQVINYHQGEIPDNFAVLLNTKEYEINDDSKLGNVKVYDVTALGNNFTIYEHVKKGTYYDGFKVHEGNIVILLLVDDSGVIKNVLLPEDLYEQTGGNFYNSARAHAELLIDQNINDPIVDMDASATDNSIGSKVLINQIITEIKEALSWKKLIINH